MLVQNVKFIWLDQQQSAFKLPKEVIVKALLIYHLDYSLPIVLHTDASNLAIGGTLTQPVEREGKVVDRVVALMSQRLSPTASR